MLQRRKTRPVGDDILEEPQFPNLLPEEFLARKTQQLDQEWIHIHDRSGLDVENQNAVFGRFEELPIEQFGVRTCSWRSVTVSRENDGEIICKIR